MAYRSPYPGHHVPTSNLTEQVFGHAAKKPDAIAMADGLTGRTITYGDLLEQIRQTAAGLAARGIKKGDVVSLWSPNVPEWPVVFFAVVQARRDRAHFESRQHARRARLPARRRQVEGARSRSARSPTRRRRRSRNRRSRSSSSRSTRRPAFRRWHQSRSTRIRRPCRSILRRTSCVLPYSSGTTGLPKGVMLTHRNLVAQLNQIDAIESVQTPALLGVLPFFHIYGMVIIVMHGSCAAQRSSRCRSSSSSRS